MASPAFIAAASAATREPVVLVSVESVTTDRQVVTTDTDWGNATSKDAALRIEAGSVDIWRTIDLGDLAAEPAGGWYGLGTFSSAIDMKDAAIAARAIDVLSSYATQTSVDVATVRLYYSTLHQSFATGTVDAEALEFAYTAGLTIELWGKRDGGSAEKIYGPISHDAPPLAAAHSWISHYADVLLTSGNWEFAIKLITTTTSNDWSSSPSGGNPYTDSDWYPHARIEEYQGPSGTGVNLVTASVGPFEDENGDKYTQDSVLTVEDEIPPGTTMAYTITGSDNNTDWTSLGSVSDGDTVAPYKYYRVTAIFGTDGIYSPLLHELVIAGGNSQFAYYSTHRDQPMRGALPLVAEGLGTITSKIEPAKLPSVGETSVNLVYCQPTFDLLRDGSLRNKSVSIKVGFVGLNEPDFEPYFAGIWHDATIDHRKGQISVKVRSPLAKFAKVQLPAETAANAARSDTNVVPITWTTLHAMDVALDIYDKMGIPDRFLDRASFGTAETTLGTDYNLSRTLDKDAKGEAKKLLEELSQITGTWFIPGADGKLAATVYDATASTVADLNARVVDFGPAEMGMEALFTRQHIYYSLIAGEKGGAAEDFANAYVLINDVAEIAWGLNKDVPDTDPDYRKNPGYSREFFDLWSMTQAAREALADRWDAWFATPKMKIKASGVPPAYFHIQPGQLVGVTGLQLPVTGLNWGDLTSAKKFLVTGRTFDPTKCTLSLDLLEV